MKRFALLSLFKEPRFDPLSFAHSSAAAAQKKMPDLDRASGSHGNPNTDFHIGKIDGKSHVTIYGRNVYISGKIDGQSIVTIHASGTVTINDKIDGQSTVYAYCRNITIGGKIDGQCYVGCSSAGSCHGGVRGESVFTRM